MSIPQLWFYLTDISENVALSAGVPFSKETDSSKDISDSKDNGYPKHLDLEQSKRDNSFEGFMEWAKRNGNAASVQINKQEV